MSNKQKSHTRDPVGREAEVAEQAAAKWDAANAAAVRATQITRDEFADQLETARKHQRDAQNRLRNTPGRVRMSVIRNGNDEVQTAKDVPFADWNFWDQLTAVSAGTLAVILVLLGAGNVATALLNSGVATFIEHPWSAWLFGALVPAVSMAAKAGYSLFDHAVNRKRYAWAIYISAIASGACWVVLFALSYEGASAGVDWDSIGQTTTADRLASSLTIIQIVTEVLAAAALFIVVANAFASYSASYEMDNPELPDARSTFKDRDAEYQSVLAQFAAADGECAELAAERQVFIKQAVENWRSMQAARAQN